MKPSRKQVREKIEFVDWDESKNYLESPLGLLGGWFKEENTWIDYLTNFNPKQWCRIMSLKSAIISNKVRCTGAQHQNGATSCPVFPDGTCATYSMRAWGDLMAAVWGWHDKMSYSYMDFYM